MQISAPPEHEVNAELCRRSFYFFFCQFWETIEGDDLHLNWHLKFLCDEAQKIMECVFRGDKEIDDLLVDICPGTTKSTIYSIALPAWSWTRKPDCVILCNTISNENATKFSLKFKDMVTSDKYQEYFPEIIVRRDSSAIKRIQNTLGGARRQYTTKGTIIGDHGHVRIDDDPMSFEDARSDAETERCIVGYKSYSTREKKNVKVPYFLVMQRLSEQDTASYVMKTKPDIKKIVLPAWNNGKIFPPELAENYVDGLLNPVHINHKFLADKKMGLGDLRYLAEYGQDCETQEGYLYTINKVPKMEQKGVCIAVCDPADDGDCYLATVFARIYNNRCYIIDMVYTKDDSDITIPINAEKAKQHKPYAFFIENDGLGAMYYKALRTKYGLTQKFNAKGNKVDRIFSKGNIISKFFVFLEQSPNPDYENAVNHIITYKKVGTNKYKDIEDALTSLATIIERNNLINFYA